MPDPPHREHNQLGKALKDANQSYLRTDAAFLGNALSGPWGASANLDTLAESCSILCKSIAVDDSLFQDKYERLARGLNNGMTPFDYGTTEGMQRVLDLVAENKWSKGAVVKLSRWWRWIDKVGPMLDDFAIMEFILSDIGPVSYTHLTLPTTPYV